MFATLIWLKDSGFIDFESTINDDFIYNAILSAKGLELLKQKPKSLEHKKSFGEWLNECEQTGKDEIIRKSASELLHYWIFGKIILNEIKRNQMKLKEIKRN